MLFLTYQWTDFRRKQNNPHKWTLNSMFCWFDFFLLFFLIYFSCLFFLAFFLFYFDLVKVVCRLNFVSYYLMKIDPVWYYQASGPMTCIFCYMFMQVYFLSTLDWICVIHIWVRLNVEILAVRPDNSAYRKPKIMKIRRKLRVLLTSLLNKFYSRIPVLKENYDR